MSKLASRYGSNNMNGLQGQEYFWHSGETVNIKVRKRCKPVSEFSTKTPNTRTMPVTFSKRKETLNVSQSIKLIFSRQGWRDGSQWLRATTALREDQSPVPNPTRLQVAHSNSRGSDTLFWTPITLHTDTDTQECTQVKNKLRVLI